MSSHNPKEVYEHGMRFLATDGFLRMQAENNEILRYWARVPGMVLSAFASELFLKCLLLIEGKDHLAKGHNLRTLFDSLAHAHQSQIQALWDADQNARKADIDEEERKAGVSVPRDLPTALSDCGDAFVLLRYVYEDPSKVRFYITFFPIVLRDVIRSITGWDQQQQ